MNRLTPKKALKILNKARCSLSVIQHCKAVSAVAIRLAQEINRERNDVDEELILLGGLLHDIGRSKTHGIDHAVVGADIARSFNVPTTVIRIIERHIGSGISADEAIKLGLPERDFIPKTLEEKIVSYADKLVEGKHEMEFEEALAKFSKEFGDSHIMVKRFKKIHSEFFPKSVEE